MRLTKRQLKKIIREEYSRLKRRGLINEMYDDGGSMGAPMDSGLQIDVERICDIIMEADEMGDYDGYCNFAESMMFNVLPEVRNEMSDMDLMRMGIFDGADLVCPPTAQEFCDLLKSPKFQNSPVGPMIIDALYGE